MFECRLIVLTSGLRDRVLCRSFQTMWGKNSWQKPVNTSSIFRSCRKNLERILLPTVPFTSECLFL